MQCSPLHHRPTDCRANHTLRHTTLQLISENGLELEYTVVLCLFSGEEQGLLGSRAYAQHLAELNTNVVAMCVADASARTLCHQTVL
jgi:Zn-dependent M28 family amino/carboxypeptidase